jgi:hypothetical protein
MELERELVEVAAEVETELEIEPIGVDDESDIAEAEGDPRTRSRMHNLAF